MSGGIDSTVLAYFLANQKSQNIRALYINLDRKPSIHEIASAKKTAVDLGIPIEILDISGLDKLMVGYIPIKYLQMDECDTGQDNTITMDYAKARCGFPVMLSAASMYAHALNIEEINIALTKEQILIYPEMKTFFNDFTDSLATFAKTLPPVRFETPFSKFTKAEIIAIGHKMGINLADTWSCFYGGTAQDGTCNACKGRKKAFVDSGVHDATIYES